MTTPPTQSAARSPRPVPPTQYQRFAKLSFIAPLLIAIAVLLSYSGAPGNAFALDDWHGITDNPSVRDLDKIPSYFRDAKTMSILSTNIDYRPILQVTYAINYNLTKYDVTGPHTDSWHWTNILIHMMVSWSIFLLGRRLFGSLGLAPIPGLPAPIADACILAAAILFAAHPISAACVNYISARSSSLTTMFVMFSLHFYLRGLARPHRWWRFACSGLLFALAMLTKVEAISVLAAFFLAEVLLNPANRGRSIAERATDWRPYARFVPMVVLGVSLVLLWKNKTGLTESSTRAGVGVTSGDYLFTQFRAWWYYIAQIFAPINLIADYPTYPLSNAKAFWQGHEHGVLLALAGWVLVGFLALATLRRAPVVSFLIVCFFAYLSPHSSVIPFAEPVNEHRPYLADTCVFLLLAIAAGMLLARFTLRPRSVLAAASVILLIPLTLLARDRTKVWLDDETLWGDNVKKTPDSTRVQMNYGLALMRKGKDVEAEARFREAIRLAPNYHYAWSNLGIILAKKGDYTGALAAHASAINTAGNLDQPWYWRARCRAELRDIPGAAADFQTAISKASSPYRELAGAAECLLRLGKSAEAQALIDRGQSIDPKDFDLQRAQMRALLGPTDANTITIEADKLRDDGKWFQAEWRYREALRIDATNVPNHINMGIVLAHQGNAKVAQEWFDYAAKLQPNSDVPLYWRGRFHASLGNWDAALADFRGAQSFGPNPIRDYAAIIETLTAAGRGADAAIELGKIDPAQAVALEAERTAFRARVFKAK